MLRFAFLAYLLLMAFAALAQSTVSGVIATDSHWTVAQSPYVINGDVIVQNGATLRIDSGVTVYMASNASITIQAGSLRAEGVEANPIRVLSDKTRVGQTAAPGDWKRWVFDSGTTNTRLDYVNFEHGSGLLIKGSAPVLNYVAVRNQAGPAIEVDLAASPTGVGNQATGNTLNGILVPPGDILGTVKWGIRGIPYIVSSGMISVGASPSIANLTPSTLQQGETATINITGSRLQGLSGVSFNKAGLNASILPGASDTQATITVNAEATVPVGPADINLEVDAGEVRLANALSVSQSQPVITALAPTSLYLGQGSIGLSISGRNFTSQSVAMINGVEVTTQYQSPTQLSINLTPPGAAGNLRVQLKTSNPTQSGQFLLSNEWLLPVVAAQITVSPTTVSVVKGGSKALEVSLPYQAPAGGLGFNLVSSVPTVATVPATVLVTEGQTSASVQLSGTEIGSTVITASGVGFISGQSQVSVVTPPTLSLTPATSALGTGRAAQITLQSSNPAGSSGLLVGLSSSDATIATTPASVTIPAGASTAVFNVSTVAIGNATITAQAPDFASATAQVTVRPMFLNLPAGALGAPGLSRSIPIMLSDPAPVGGLVITLSSDAPAVASVPTTLSIAEGQTTGNFVLTGVATGAANILATASGYQSALMPVTVEAITISIGSPAVSSISLPVDTTQSFPVILSKPAPAGGVVVSLSTADASKASVAPAVINIAEGQTSGGVVLATVTGMAQGAASLTATAAGLNSANVPITVTEKPKLVFSTTTLTVAKGLKTAYYEVYVYRAVNGTGVYGSEALTVNLTSSDASKASVPASITIAAWESYAYFYVTAVDLTNGVPVSIDASASGYSAPATKLAVNVEAPVFAFSYLDSNSSPASGRNFFTVYVTTPGADDSGNRTAEADLPINLALVDANPAGIVDGFYSDYTGGTAITQVLLRKGTSSEGVYVGTPTVAGSYKVQASAVGVGTSTSGVVTVGAPELRFYTSDLTVGKGLKTAYYEAYVYRAVNGRGFYGSEALTVNLTSSDASKASVPASITIAAWESYAYFYVTGVDLTNGVPVSIDASASGYSAPATKLAVNVVAPVFTFGYLDSNLIPASGRNYFSLYVTTPGIDNSGSQAAVADLPINLALVDANPAGIVDGFYSEYTGGTAITQVLLRKDNTSSDGVFVGTPTVAGSYKVQASAVGVGTATSGVVTVSAPELTFSTSAVTVGKGLKTYEAYVYRSVNGRGFYGSEALTVNLSCSSTVICKVPATVTIPAGQSYGYFVIEGMGLGSTTVMANAVGYSATQDLAVNVVMPQLNFSGLANTAVGGQSNFSVYLTTPGASYSGGQRAAAPITVDLTSSVPGVATVSSSVTIQVDNAYTSTATLNGVAAGTTTLTASGSGLSTATSNVITINP